MTNYLIGCGVNAIDRTAAIDRRKSHAYPASIVVLSTASLSPQTVIDVKHKGVQQKIMPNQTCARVSCGCDVVKIKVTLIE